MVDATKRGGVNLASILGFLVVIALLAVVAWAILREDDSDPATTGEDGAVAGGCESLVTVRVATTDDFAPVVESAADRVEENDECVRYSVSTAPSSVTADQIRAGTARPDVWIPDSDVWVDRVNQSPDAPTLSAGPTLATSLAVLAVPNSLAESTGLSGPQPWQAILSGPLELRLGDPEESTTSMLLLHAADQAIGDSPQGEQLLGAHIIRMSRQAQTEEELLAQASDDGEDATAVAATEQQIYRQRLENPDVPLTAVVPADGTGALVYSWVAVPGPDQGAATRSAVSDLEQSLTGVAGVADREDAGFRLPDGEAPEVPGIPAGTEPALTAPTLDDADAVVALWNIVAVDMRMLAVIDVSGSMLEPVGDQNRISLAAASAHTALEVFPTTSQVGLWIFSTDHPGGADWTELVPIAPLDSPSGDGLHRDALLGATAALPSHTVEGGDTGLYDTVLAAYREVQANYEPGFVNSVVLLTDGKNEDDNSITLSELLAELQASVDPAKPIPIITVGMGTGTDEEVLRIISAQTGGRSYLARNPADIGTVFVDALTHRFRAG